MLNEVKCEVPFGGIGSVPFREALEPDQVINPTDLHPSEPIRLTAEDEVRQRVVFTFWVNRAWWSRCPADRQTIRMQKDSSLIKH